MGESGFISQGILCHKVEDLTVGRAGYGGVGKNQELLSAALPAPTLGERPSLGSWGKRATQPKSHTRQAWAYRLREELH
jgi:hypothetical protein